MAHYSNFAAEVHYFESFIRIVHFEETTLLVFRVDLLPVNNSLTPFPLDQNNLQMGRKSKETLAKEARTLELNQKRFASFFKPKTSTVAKQPLKELSPNINRVKDFDESLKPVKVSSFLIQRLIIRI